MIFAVAFPVLLLATAGAIDFASALRQKTRLQHVVDAAALGAAKELSLSNSKTTNVDSVVTTLVNNYVKAAQTSGKHPTISIKTQVHTSPLQVEVNASQRYQSIFGDSFAIKSGDFEATAVAQVVGRPNICVLALHPSTNGALSLEQKARVTGENCGVFSNSTHNIGIKTKNSATLKATTICSAGGVQGNGRSFEPPPYLDCPSFEDPLGQRPEPSAGPCTGVKPTEITTSQQLAPGTYCGLKISNSAKVKLESGIYIIKDGPLIVTDSAQIYGEGVGFYLTGSKASLEFADDSTISIEAPTSGPMAGLLVFASRKTTQGVQHKIFSENAQVMVGTIYIPTGELRVDGSAEVGSQSAYTAIVAETVRLYGGPHIVLNTNYSETDVPVPDGIQGAGQPVQIVQ